MKAAVLVEPCKIEIEDVPVPEAGPGEVVLKVFLAGICGSDNALYHGKCGVPFPVIPGHEAIGRVEKVGDGVENLTRGQRVTIQPNFSCGDCPLCRDGYRNICADKIRLGIDVDGVFAEYVKVPADYVWGIPEGLDNDIAVLAEPLAVAAHALRRRAPRSGDRVLIFGAGLIGLLTLQLAVLAGAEVTACDLEASRLELAKSLGATNVIGPQQRIEDFHNMFDLIYETSGAPPALAQTIQLAAPRGKIVMLGLPSQENPIPGATIVRKELEVVGSMIYTDEFPYVLDLLSKGKIKTEPLISAKIDLGDLDDGMKDFALPERVKTLVRF